MTEKAERATGSARALWCTPKGELGCSTPPCPSCPLAERAMSEREKFLNRGVAIDPNNIPEGLRTNKLTRRQKKDHLAGKGIKGAAAEEILEQLYGAEQ